jgi:diguanylate cyclase (GGDEF)-like protein
LKALVADDNSGFRMVLERMLRKWGYDVVAVSDGIEALAALQATDPPRLAILDWMMPGIDGVEVCRRVREKNQEPYIYILLLTARDSAEELVEGMEAGADDYLRKPVDSHELRVRVRAGRRILDLQEEVVQGREALRQLATRDPLTSLWNRNAMLEILGRELKRAERESSSISLLMADLDSFKQINDTLGHAAGDAVLQEAARRITCCVRPYDSVCRYGGEEFLIVLPGCDLADATLRAEQIRATMAATPFQIAESNINLTVLLLVAASSGPDGFDATLLTHEADDALYTAKRGGRNRVECLTPQAVMMH